MRPSTTIAAIAFVTVLRAQQADSGAPQGKVFSVSTTLVQVDAVVTDSKGHQVKNLEANDFEVRLDGKPQQITNVSYVRLDSPTINQKALPAEASSNPARAYVVRPEDVHRSMVLVVDDLGLSFESMYSVRRTLHHFLDEEMQPGDLVAIWETGRGNSVFQQFTSDKRVLEAAVENLKWNIRGRGLLDAFPSPNERDRQWGEARSRTGEPSQIGIEGEQDERDYLEAGMVASTLGTINELLDELREVGGRKAVVLFSDGIAVLPQLGGRRTGKMANPVYANQLAMLRHLIDKANRSGAVLYTIDVRGLVYIAPDPSPNAGLQESPAQILWEKQEGLVELAESTGGVATINSNGYSDAMRRIEEDQEGYYLIAFRAPDDISTGRREKKLDFHSVRVNVKVRGLKLRSRKGFFGETDEASLPRRDTPEAQMRAAVLSLFNRADIHVRLSARYGRTSVGKPVVRNLLYIEARDVTFTKGNDGREKAGLDLAIVASGSGLDPLARMSRHIAIDGNSEQAKELRSNGLVFTLDVPLKSAGPYQVRASVRDSTSGAMGSSGQFVQVPDLKKQHMAMTTPLIDDASSKNKFGDASAILREFHAGSQLSFVSVIETDQDGNSGSARGKVDAEINLYRDATRILTSPVSVATVQGETIRAVKGELKLPESLAPGQYYLEAQATDYSGKQPRSATTWIDFQVVH